jgi:Fic family protein
VLNNVVALQYGLERLATFPVSLRLIREIHLRLLQGVRGEHSQPGEFRTRQNWIGGDTINSAAFVPPPVNEMHQALNAFERYLHFNEDGYPPLVRLAFIHYQFEAIHPFSDGNGRIGRLLLSLLLISWQQLPLPLLYMSAYFERHRQRYYELLMAVSQKGAWREWVVFVLEGFLSQAKDTIFRIKQLQDLQSGWRRQLDDVNASHTVYRLLDIFLEYPVLSVPQAERLLGVSYTTAQRSIERLLALGIITSWKDVAYDRKFFAPSVISILSDKSL